jgi:hypothetical protein
MKNGNGTDGRPFSQHAADSRTSCGDTSRHDAELRWRQLSRAEIDALMHRARVQRNCELRKMFAALRVALGSLGVAKSSENHGAGYPRPL